MKSVSHSSLIYPTKVLNCSAQRPTIGSTLGPGNAQAAFLRFLRALYGRSAPSPAPFIQANNITD